MWPREDIDCLVESIVKTLHNNQILSDLIIRLKDGTTLYGHKFVLASRSKVWYNQFINNSSYHTPSSPTTPSTTTNITADNTNHVTSSSCSSSSTPNPTNFTSVAATSTAQNTNTCISAPITELDWSDFDSEIATIILAWVYNGELELDSIKARDEKFIYSIMKVAKKFKLAQLINQCEKNLQNPPPTPNSLSTQAPAQPSSSQSTPQSQQQQQPQQAQQHHPNPPTTKQHSQHSLSHLPATTRMKLSHLRAQIKRQASKAARSKLEKRSSVSGETSAAAGTSASTNKHHLMPGGHNQDSLHQKNFKQKLIALIKKFRTDDSDFDIEEQYREALEREIMEAAAGRGSRAIEELLEEDIEVEEECGSEAEDWDNISETSTPKPSLRPFFSSTTLDKI